MQPSNAPKRRGRPKGAASIVAEKTGLNIRTVQRALAKGAAPLSDEQMAAKRFLEAFRNFATFCRENDPEAVLALHVSTEQLDKVRVWNAGISRWLADFNGRPDSPGDT